jgi:hypothetical protein
MGHIRERETDRVPLSPNCGYWFLVVKTVNGKIEHEAINLSKSGASKLLKILEKFKDKQDECSVFHVWNGNYRTDLFLMDMPLLIERLEAEIASW